MKLSAQMKQSWMNECTKRLVPTDEQSSVAPQDFLLGIYNTWYERTLKKYEGTDIMPYINSADSINISMTYKNKQLDELLHLYSRHAYEGRGSFYSLGSFMSEATTTRPTATDSSVFYSQASKDGYRSRGLTVEISDDEFEAYTALVAEQAASADTIKKIMRTTHGAITSVNTDGQLKEKFPAIYSNMSPYVRSAINDDIEKKSSAKLERQRAKAREVLDIVPDEQLTPEELAYREAETALQKAAFINT